MALLFRHNDGSESSLLPLDLTLLITDSLEAPSTFLIVQQIALALKLSPRKRRCILVGAAHSFEHYNSLLKKQGIQLVNERDRQTFTFVDALTLLVDIPSGLESLLIQVASLLAQGEEDAPLIIFDDFSSFLYGGADPLLLLRTYRKILSLARRRKASVLTVLHDDAFSPPKRTPIEREADDAFLIRSFVQLTDVWVQTRSLRAQMTGELIVHRGPTLLDRQSDLVSHPVSRATQYKLEETGPTFFAKGTGKGFL